MKKYKYYATSLRALSVKCFSDEVLNIFVFNEEKELGSWFKFDEMFWQIEGKVEESA
jgi:hypothetical protein